MRRAWERWRRGRRCLINIALIPSEAGHDRIYISSRHLVNVLSRSTGRWPIDYRVTGVKYLFSADALLFVIPISDGDRVLGSILASIPLGKARNMTRGG